MAAISYFLAMREEYIGVILSLKTYIPQSGRLAEEQSYIKRKNHQQKITIILSNKTESVTTYGKVSLRRWFERNMTCEYDLFNVSKVICIFCRFQPETQPMLTLYYLFNLFDRNRFLNQRFYKFFHFYTKQHIFPLCVYLICYISIDFPFFIVAVLASSVVSSPAESNS